MRRPLYILGGLWEGFPQHKLPLTAVVASRWVTVGVVAALWLQIGWSWLDRIEKRHGSVPMWQQSLLVLAITAATELVGEPLALQVVSTVHSSLHVAVRPFWQGRPLAAVLMQMWTQGAPAVFVVYAFATSIRAYLRSVRDGWEALRRTQIVIAESQRRAVAQRLQSTQAAVDPPFLFSTLRGIEAAFLHDPLRAQRMLGALIRYLRAALPAASDGGCTLGEQADLVRAWAEIVDASGAHALEASVDVPPGLRAQPFAPLILLPLAAAATADHARRIALRAWSEPGRLIVELATDRSLFDLTAVRLRIAALYGDSASLVAAESQAGASARIEFLLTARP